MDTASQALTRGVPAPVSSSYRALADYHCVPYSIFYYRTHGQRSIEEKTRSQQYLSPAEDKAVVDFLLHMSQLRQPVRLKYIPGIAVSAAQ